MHVSHTSGSAHTDRDGLTRASMRVAYTSDSICSGPRMNSRGSLSGLRYLIHVVLIEYIVRNKIVTVFNG